MQRYFCPECGAEFAEKQTRYGVSIVRGRDVYCHMCFVKAFPDECENHPGIKADRFCANCGKKFCGNCILELQGEQVCRRCKGIVLAGLESEQSRPIGKLGAIAYRLSRGMRPSQPVVIFIAGILGFIVCGIPGIMAIMGYARYREKVARNRAKRSILATAGFVLGVLSLAGYALLLFMLVLSG